MDAAEMLAAARSAGLARLAAIESFAYDARIERVVERDGLRMRHQTLSTTTFNGEALRIDQVRDTGFYPIGEAGPTQSETIIYSGEFRKLFIWRKEPNELHVARRTAREAIWGDPLNTAFRPEFVMEQGLADAGRAEEGTARVEIRQGYHVHEFTVDLARGGIVTAAVMRNPATSHETKYEFVYAAHDQAGSVPESARIVDRVEGMPNVTTVRFGRIAINNLPPRGLFILELPRGTIVVDEATGARTVVAGTISADEWLERREREAAR